MNLSKSDITATIAVSDLDKAKEFYGNTLGLEQSQENPAGVGYKGAKGEIFVYKSDTAGSGKATCANFMVGDIAGTAKELKSKGVNFDHFDMPGAEWDGDVATMGDMKAAWFKDPDGNILGLTQS